MKLANRVFQVIIGLLGVILFAIGKASADGQYRDITHANAAEEVPSDVSMSDWERLQSDLQAAKDCGANNSVRGLKWIDLELRWKIAEQGGIPKWDGEKLMDVSDSICGAEGLDFEDKSLLAKLNYWEQAYGMTSMPPEMRDNMARGEADAAIELYVLQLEERGISVELDVDEGLWKVVKDGVD